MNFKVITNNKIIGVVTNEDFFRYQKKHKAILASTIDQAQFVILNGLYYRDNWLKDPGDDITCIEATIDRIGDDEYLALSEALQTEEQIVVEEPIEEITIQEVDNPDNPDEPDTTLEYVKAMKIEQINQIATNTISEGFDLELSDGHTHHFSLTTNDQLNLITISTLLASGETMIPYHADGELCAFYSAADAMAIINKATAFKSYIITYCNSLKAYVNSLETIGEISAVQYGDEIPAAYQSDVLKVMLSPTIGSGGNV